MPIHFTVSEHDANPVKKPYRPIESADQLLASTWGENARTVRSKELLQTSLVKPDFTTIHAQNNGFVDTVLVAYNQHHHLILRPDDVWIAILAQFNFYVNAHAEELRSHFVAHEGKKKLIVYALGSRYTVDFGDIARQMTSLIDENVVDKTMKDWIIPDFSTTSHNDTVICSVLMMSISKAYFSYGIELSCGIPTVTLEGEKEDWEKLLSRLDKLDKFGEEPKAWASLLRPILSRFVNAFDGQPDIDFWKRVCHIHANFSGPTYLSGWLTAFCVWDSSGKWQGPPLAQPVQAIENYYTENIEPLVLDGTRYSVIQERDVPSGFCDVDVELNDNGEMFECMMVSGHLASSVEGETKDTIRPLPAWFMFIKEECEDPEEVAIRELVAKFEKDELQYAQK